MKLWGWSKSAKNSNDLNKSLDKRSKISHLDPFLDGDEVISVRGRLEKSFLNNDCKHPILFPKVGKITDLLIKHYHKLTGHSGWGITLNKIHSTGYWIVYANSAVKNIIYNCIKCCRYRERLGEQKMARFIFLQVKWECPFHSLWTLCSQACLDPLQSSKEVKRSIMELCLLAWQVEPSILKLLLTWIQTHSYRAMALWLRCWIANPGVLHSKPVVASRLT